MVNDMMCQIVSKISPNKILGSLMNKSSLIRFFAVIIGLVSIIHLQAMNQKKMVVRFPVTDLRTGPGAMPQGVTGPALSKDTKTPETEILQDSQLLLNEPVLVLEDDTNHPGWYKVQALLQPAFEDGKWGYCTGYVQTRDLGLLDKPWNCQSVIKEKWAYGSIGTPIIIDGRGYEEAQNSSRKVHCYLKEAIELPLDTFRNQFIQMLTKFVGCPYVWGGCSSYNPQSDCITGVDCSALGHLSMRSLGLIIPRNSHAQYLMAVGVNSGTELKPGDAVYLRRKDRERMNHVLYYLGGEEFIEAFSGGAAITSKYQVNHPEYLFKTRIVLSSEAFGYSVSELANGREFSRHGILTVMYLRTFFPSIEYVQSMRDAFLMIDQV